MNPLIKEQLQNVKLTIIPEYDEDTQELLIAKRTYVLQEFVCRKCYLVELANYLVNPPPNFDLHINWNKGMIPKDRYLSCEVIQINGNMIKVSGIGYDIVKQQPTSNIWEGWLPRKGLTILKEI